MRVLKIVACLAITVCFQTASLMACEQFKPIDEEVAQKLMDTFNKQDATAMSRIFAFKTLSCAQEPIVRRFALEEGLKSKEPLLRAQAMAETLMQRDSFRIELIEEPSLTPEMKRWVTQKGGSLVYASTFHDRAKNCIGIYSTRCEAAGQITIDGTKIRIMSNGMFGELSLQPDNSLRGLIKPDAQSPSIPVRMTIL